MMKKGVLSGYMSTPRYANTKEYDTFDRVIKEVNEQGVAISNEYDVYGQLIKKTEDKKTTCLLYTSFSNCFIL